MEIKSIAKGLKTLLPFYDDPDGYHTGISPDQYYVYPTDKPLTDKALEVMVSLGWYQEYNGRDYNKDFSPTDYRPSEGWACYI